MEEISLEYEGLSEDEGKKLRGGYFDYNGSFIRDLIDHGRKHDIHELGVKPRLGVSSNDLVVEVGVGQGQHVGSYKDYNYVGFDVDSEDLNRAKGAAEFFKMDPNKLKLRKGVFPLDDSTVGGLFSVCALHEMDDIESELAEFDRVLEDGGRVVIAERMCSFAEGGKQQRNLRREPALFTSWFGDRGYSVKSEKLSATYWGESSNPVGAVPMFTFYLFSATKK